MYLLIRLVGLVFQVANILIFLRILLSWIAPQTRNEFTELVYNTTEPILKPFRLLIPAGRINIDISPILAIFVLRIAQNLIYRLLYLMF